MPDTAAVLLPATEGASRRPILIDSQDGPCEICTAHQTGMCDRCKCPFNSHLPEEMKANGYESPRPTHYHLRHIEGVPGREGKYEELCRACYGLAFEESYPGVECPIPMT